MRTHSFDWRQSSPEHRYVQLDPGMTTPVRKISDHLEDNWGHEEFLTTPQLSSYQVTNKNRYKARKYFTLRPELKADFDYPPN